MVAAAAGCAVLGRMLKLPTIVSFLAAGLLLGPASGLVDPSHAIETISEIGIVLLLFLVGLELSFEKIRDVGFVAVVAGVGQLVLTAVGGMLLCTLLGFRPMEALFLAVALTFSSTVVVVKVLGDKNELDSLYGRIAVGIFLVQDVAVVIALTMLAGLRQADGSGGSAMWEIARAFGGMGLLVAVLLAASRYILPRPFAWAAGSPGTLFIWSLGWCFACVSLARALGLPIEIGAFLAGLSLAQLPYNRDLQHRIKPLMNFFVAIFFVSLGLGMQPGAAASDWVPVAVLSLFVLIGKTLILFPIIARFGYGERTSFLAGITVAQISEFSFIFVAMGAAVGLVGNRILAITAMVGVVTIAVSAYLILYNAEIYRWLKSAGWLKPFRTKPATRPEDDAAALTGHVIVVGMNSLGRTIASKLHAGGEVVLAIDTDPRKLRGLPCKTMLGSTEYADVLADAGLPTAKLLVSALRIEEANELLAYRCRQFGIPCSIHAIDLSMVDGLLELGAIYLMLSKVDGVKHQTRHLRQTGVLPT